MEIEYFVQECYVKLSKPCHVLNDSIQRKLFYVQMIATPRMMPTVLFLKVKSALQLERSPLKIKKQIDQFMRKYPSD